MSRDELRQAYDRISGRFPADWDVRLAMQASVGSSAVRRHLYDRFTNKLVAHTSHRPLDVMELALEVRFDGKFYSIRVASLRYADVDEAVEELLRKISVSNIGALALIPLGGGSGRAA